MQENEMELRNKLAAQLTDLRADLVEFKSRFLEVQNEVSLIPKPTPSEAWLLRFISSDALPQIDEWIAGFTRMLMEQSLLFSSEAIFWIGGIIGIPRAFDGVDWVRWPKLKELSGTAVPLASDIYGSIYKYRNPSKP